MKALRLATLLAGLALVGAAPARAGAAPAAPSAAAAADPRVRRQDPADSLYRAAREALGRGDYRQAETLFRRLTATHVKSPYYSDALYYQAFALYRAGGTSDLQRARQVLQAMRGDTTRTVTAALRRDALSLDTRVCGELARRGDENCARIVRQRADSGGFVGAVSAAVDVAVASAAEAMASPAVARAMGEAQAAAVQAGREGARAAAQAMESPEVQRASADAGREAARAAQDGMRAGAEAMRDVASSMGGMGSLSGTNRARRNPNCRDADDDERVIAINALQQMDAERAMPILRKVLARREECSETLRRRAVFLVAQKKSPESAELLVTAARTDPNAEVREEAVHWLSRVGGDRAIDFLRDVARSDTSVTLRKRAVYALSQSKEARARETLRTLASTSGTTPEVRSEAIYWIGRGDAADVQWLRQLFPSLESRELKERALSTLSRQKDIAPFMMDVARDTREPIEVRKSALGWAARNATAPQLVTLWDATKEKELRESLILALSRRKEPEALDKLIAIARTEQDRELRKSAVFWLSRSSEPRALAFLQELIER
ncbi:MAG: HEAT repeat domain-containing protein [Gemmatirosa sp.]